MRNFYFDSFLQKIFSKLSLLNLSTDASGEKHKDTTSRSDISAPSKKSTGILGRIRDRQRHHK